MSIRNLRTKLLLFFVQIIAVVGGVCFVLQEKVLAQSRSLAEPKTKLDVILLFDTSGSMLKTDPKDLRAQGATVLFSFLREDDYLGIVSFSDVAKVQRELQPFSPSRARTISDRLKSIEATGRYTDVAAGVNLAKTLLKASARPEAQQVIVLLSDGKNEPDPRNGPVFAATLQMVHDILPDLRSHEIKVFTMALSEEADRAFLGEISAATNGLTWFVKDTESIHKAYADLFLALKRPQILNQSGHEFRLEEEYAEVTFYINHGEKEALSLVTPRGSALTQDNHPDYIVWHSEKKFDVITVKVPDQGVWQVVGTEEHDGFAALISELRVLTDWPISVHEDEKTILKARLYDSNKPIQLPEMSQLIKVGFQVTPMDRVAYPIMRKMLNDDGRDGDEVAGDGIFSLETKILAPGSYKMTVTAKGPTFKRSQRIPFMVRPRLLTLSVNAHGDSSHSHASAKESKNTVEGNSDSHFSILLSKEVLSYRDYKLFLHAKAGHGDHIKLPIEERSSLREFDISAEQLPKVGDYQVYVSLEAQDKKGRVIEAISNEVQFILNEIAVQPTIAHEPAPKHEEVSKARNWGELLPPLGLISVVNLIIGVALVALIGKRTRRKKGDIKRYIPNKQVIDAVASTQEATTQIDIDFNHPAFSTPVEGENAPEHSSESAAAEESLADEAVGDTTAVAQEQSEAAPSNGEEEAAAPETGDNDSNQSNDDSEKEAE